MYAIFKVSGDKKGTVPKVISDEMISRQSTSVRDGDSLGFEEGITYVLVEGVDEAVEKAKDMFEDLDVEFVEDDEEIYQAIKKADEDAAAGVGTIFG